MKKKIGLVFLSVFLASTLVLFTACGDGGGGGGPTPCTHNWEVVALTEYVEFEGEIVIDAPYGTIQRVRQCTRSGCGEMTYYIPADLDLTVPQGAVWLGPWLPDGEGSANQIRWDVSDDIRARIQSGELNRFYLFLHPENIDLPGEENLASILTVVNTGRTDDSSGWRNIRPSRLNNVGPEIPSAITSVDQLTFPLVNLIDHIPGHDVIDWDHDFFQFWIQHSRSIGRLQPIAAFVGPGLATDPAPPEPPPIQGDVDVTMMFGSAEQTIRINRVGGLVTEVTNAAEEVIGFRFAKANNHRSSFVHFPVTLPGGKTLADFETVSFDFQWIAPVPVHNTAIALLARAVPITHANGHTNIPAGGGSGATVPPGGWIATGQVTDPRGVISADFVDAPATITLTIGGHANNMGYLSAADVSSSIYLSIYEHSNAATWEVTNIVFTERTGCAFSGGGACECDAAIQTAQTTIQEYTFTAIAQASAGTEAAARNAVQTQVDALSLNYVVATVVSGTFNAAVAGDSTTPAGTDGSFAFTVALSRGPGAPLSTTEQTVTITATAYVPGLVVIFDMQDEDDDYFDLIGRGPAGSGPGARDAHPIIWVQPAGSEPGEGTAWGTPPNRVLGMNAITGTSQGFMFQLDGVDTRAGFEYEFVVMGTHTGSGNAGFRLENPQAAVAGSMNPIADGAFSISFTFTYAEIAELTVNVGRRLGINLAADGNPDIRITTLRIIERPIAD